jgi:2-desacetyl-2-hydroxyethyl bacteriochlorophyllide A dehydrogenase
MRGVVYEAPGEVDVRDVDEPGLEQPTDAIVRTELAGLCGSDMHIYHGDTAGVEPGTVIGHELVGTVEATGERVSRVEPGDRVVASFEVPCGSCSACRREAYNGCPDLGIFGHGIAYGSIPGVQAEAARVPNAELVLRKVPEAVASEEALFAGDILAAAYTGVREHLEPGQDVAVVGAGPVGLLVLEVAQALGAGQTFAVELDPERAKIARDRGHAAPDPDATDPASRVQSATRGEGIELVLEAVGGQGQALDTCFELVAPGGTVCALGVPIAYEFEFPWLNAFTQDVTFRATLANVPKWIDEILALQEAGRLEASWLTSHRMSLDDAPEAYRLFDDQEALKVVFEV